MSHNSSTMSSLTDKIRAHSTLSLKGAAVFLIVVYAVALFPLIRANASYIDDLGRVVTGHGGWSNFSRFLSEFFSQFVHASDFLADISPLTQIIAVLAIVAASLILVRAVRGSGDSFSVWDLIAVVPLGLSPYFLECLSYKYDAPYMALSILFAILPLALRARKPWLYCVAVALCTLGTCTTYQAGLGIFPMSVLLIALLEWMRGGSVKDSLVFVGVSAASFIVGVLVFFLFVMTPTEDSEYVSNSIATLPMVIENYAMYFQLVCSDFRTIWLLVAGALALCFPVCAVMQSKQGKAISALVVLVVLVLMVLLMFGLYPLLAQPLDSPRAMYGVGAFIALVALGGVVCASGAIAKCATRVLALCLAWCFVVFACAYGNAIAQQAEWEDFRRAEVITDLTDLEEFKAEGQKIVQLEGSAGFAPAIGNELERYRLMQRLIPVTFQGNWFWGSYKLDAYYGLENTEVVVAADEQYVDDYSDFSLVDETSYHAIYEKDGHFVIELK